MKLKLDENLSRHLKPVLIELGHDVLTAADENLLSHPRGKTITCQIKQVRDRSIEPQGFVQDSECYL
jgi:hypothetical protein